MKLVITDERIPKECLSSLGALGFDILTLPPDRRLPSPVASHTDMLLFKCNKTFVASKDYLRIAPAVYGKLASLKGYTLVESDEAPRDAYPHDAIFNAAIIGDRLLAKTDTVARDVIRCAKDEGLKVIHTRQGYPACTVLVLDKDHAITSDEGSARLLSEAGVSVLTIRNSSAVKLPPYDFGFIGGCAGVFDNKVYFVGNLDSHPDARAISSFIKDIGFDAVSLAPSLDCLFDVGGLAFIDEGAD